MFLSHVNVALSLFLPPFPSQVKNKIKENKPNYLLWTMKSMCLMFNKSWPSFWNNPVATKFEGRD